VFLSTFFHGLFEQRLEVDGAVDAVMEACVQGLLDLGCRGCLADFLEGADVVAQVPGFDYADLVEELPDESKQRLAFEVFFELLHESVSSGVIVAQVLWISNQGSLF